jgi:plasmid maintenance system antidote protein VapI
MKPRYFGPSERFWMNLQAGFYLEIGGNWLASAAS